MKQQIAGFLGELAEELGWTPELEHARVREETSQPESPPSQERQPVVVTPDPANHTTQTSPIERLQAELEQLRSTVKHLGSEVIHLRGQLAKMRNLPIPPDAGEPTTSWSSAEGQATSAPDTDTPDTPPALVGSPASPVGDAAAEESTAPDGGRWPRLFRRGVSEDGPEGEIGESVGEAPLTTSRVAEAHAPSEEIAAVVPESPANPIRPGDVAEPAGTAETVESPGEAVLPVAPMPVAPTVVHIVDGEDSALELFPSEPSSATDSSPSESGKPSSNP